MQVKMITLGAKDKSTSEFDEAHDSGGWVLVKHPNGKKGYYSSSPGLDKLAKFLQNPKVAEELSANIADFMAGMGTVSTPKGSASAKGNVSTSTRRKVSKSSK